MRKLLFYAALPLLLVPEGCRLKQHKAGPVYSHTTSGISGNVYYFAVRPLHNPARLSRVYQPLVNYLNERVRGACLRLETSRDYASFEQKYAQRIPDFILPNPLQTTEAVTCGYNVIAMAGLKEDFRGIFIVRKDAGIRTPADLKGKTVSYPSSTALAACIMAQYYLHKRGVDINRDTRSLYVGSQESSIMNVYMKNSSAGGSWPAPWRFFQKEHPKEAAELNVIWETPSLINNSVMVRNDVPVAVYIQVRDCLLCMHEDAEGRKLLSDIETEQFLPAENSDYNIVTDYIRTFEKEVRPIDLNRKKHE